MHILKHVASTELTPCDVTVVSDIKNCPAPKKGLNGNDLVILPACEEEKCLVFLYQEDSISPNT
jgi:hypothetical protein